MPEWLEKNSLSGLNVKAVETFNRFSTFNPPKEILEGYNAGKHKKGNSFDLFFCHKLIDYFKTAINQHPDWKNLFCKENLDDVVLKLNGETELFYRDIGIKNPVIHATGTKVRYAR